MEVGKYLLIVECYLYVPAATRPEHTTSYRNRGCIEVGSGLSGVNVMAPNWHCEGFPDNSRSFVSRRLVRDVC